MATIHENYSRNEIVTGGSDRWFGIVMTAAFTLISLLNWWHQGRVWRWTIGNSGRVVGGATVLSVRAVDGESVEWLEWMKER